MKVGVFLPTVLNSFAVVYLVISALVQTKWPWAPDPLACTTRSGILSRLKCAIFSNSKKSSKTTGPRGPTVSEFWLSPTGRPAAVVSFFLFMIFSYVCVGSLLIRAPLNGAPGVEIGSLKNHGLLHEFHQRVRKKAIRSSSPAGLTLRQGIRCPNILSRSAAARLPDLSLGDYTP